MWMFDETRERIELMLKSLKAKSEQAAEGASQVMLACVSRAQSVSPAPGRGTVG